MKIKEGIINIFTGKKKGDRKYNLSLFSNMITLQDKSKYSKENQIKIENYIKEYKKLLKRSVVMTPEFNNTELNKEIKMIFSLTTNIFVSEIDMLFEEKSKIKKVIISNKYKLYISDIERLISDIELRLVALRDIKLNNKFLGRKNRTLEQEIEDLSRSYITCTMQKIAIKDEVDTFMTLLQNKDFKDIDIKQLKKYYNNLKEQSSKILSKDEINSIYGNGYDIYDQIANIEKKCEEYFFNHTNYIDNIISILEKFEDNWNIWKIRNNRNSFKNGIKGNFTKRINELEKLFVFYEKYGKKVNDNIKERLYRLKFDIIANDYTLNENNLLEPEDPFVQEIYKKEVFSRINAINTNKNQFLMELLETQSFPKSEILKIKESLKEIFKDKNKGYDEELVLKNIYKLQLLVALDSKDQLIEWFKRDVDREKFLGEELNDKYFFNTMAMGFNDSIPIETICYVILHSETSELLMPLLKLYSIIENKYFSHIFHKDSTNDIYYIPEGIQRIVLYLNEIDYETRLTNLFTYEVTKNKRSPIQNGKEPITFDANPQRYKEKITLDTKKIDVITYSRRNRRKNLMSFLSNNLKDKIIVFPKSLKIASIHDYNSSELEFQNGVKDIYYEGLGAKMTIPPSVEKLEIKSEPSDWFESHLGKNIEFAELVESSDVQRELESYLNNKENFDIIFDNYKKSIFLKNYPDFIKNLPEACTYYIGLKDIYEETRSIIILQIIKYYKSWEHSEKGFLGADYYYARVPILRKMVNLNARVISETRFKNIMNSIDDREDARV